MFCIQLVYPSSSSGISTIQHAHRLISTGTSRAWGTVGGMCCGVGFALLHPCSDLPTSQFESAPPSIPAQMGLLLLDSSLALGFRFSNSKMGAFIVLHLHTTAHYIYSRSNNRQHHPNSTHRSPPTPTRPHALSTTALKYTRVVKAPYAYPELCFRVAAFPVSCSGYRPRPRCEVPNSI